MMGVLFKMYLAPVIQHLLRLMPIKLKGTYRHTHERKHTQTITRAGYEFVPESSKQEIKPFCPKDPSLILVSCHFHIIVTDECCASTFLVTLISRMCTLKRGDFPFSSGIVQKTSQIHDQLITWNHHQKSETSLSRSKIFISFWLWQINNLLTS